MNCPDQNKIKFLSFHSTPDKRLPEKASKAELSRPCVPGLSWPKNHLS